MCWWTCPLYGCLDKMADHPDPRRVERDRDAHLRARHPHDVIDPRLLLISHWPQAGTPRTVPTVLTD